MKKFCYNCGKQGHTYNICLLPVMSYGIILYRMKDGIPYYLMVQRNCTPDYKELIRGKFEFENPEYIYKLVSRITWHEINAILTLSHKELYQGIEKFYKVRKNKQYYEKYKKAKENFQKLIAGHQNSQCELIKFDKIIKRNNQTHFLEPDWGFPKGRRNYRGNESDLDCALREVCEETGIPEHYYQLAPETINFTEVYRGTNDVQYAHKYYVAQCPNNVTYYIDPNNKHQVGEIRKMEWYTYEEAVDMIRPYHEEKKKVIQRAHQEITKQQQLTTLKHPLRSPPGLN